MPLVEVPELGSVEFPDSMSTEQINSALKTHFAKAKEAGLKATIQGAMLPLKILTAPGVAEASRMGRIQGVRERVRQAQGPDEWTPSPETIEGISRGVAPFTNPVRAAADLLLRGVHAGLTKAGLPARDPNEPIIPKEMAEGIVESAADLIPGESYGAAGRGLKRSAAELLSGMTKPSDFATMLTGAPAGISYGLDMAGQSPEAAAELGRAVGEGRTEDAAAAGAQLAFGAVTPFQIAHHLAGPSPRIKIPDYEGRQIPMPRGAPVPRGEPVAMELLTDEQRAANADMMDREAGLMAAVDRPKGPRQPQNAPRILPKPQVPVEGPSIEEQQAGPMLRKWQDFVAHLKENGRGNESLDQIKEMFRAQMPQMTDEAAAALAKNAFGQKWPGFGLKFGKEAAEPIPPRATPAKPTGPDDTGEETPPTEPPPTPPPPQVPAEGQLPPADTTKFNNLTPIVRFGDVQFSGETHADAINKAIKSGKLTDDQLEAIVSGNGKFERAFLADDGKTVLNREQAAAWFKDKTGKTPNTAGELHSADLQNADLTGNEKPTSETKPVKPATPAPAGETVTLYRGDDGTGGSWFTGNTEKAASFGKEVRAVQVSKAEAEAAKEAAKKQGQGGDTYFLTRAEADKAKPVEAPPEKVIDLDETETPPGEKPPTPPQPPVSIPAPSVEAPKMDKPAEAPAAAAAKVETQVEKVAATEGARPAREVKSELVSRLEKAIAVAPTEADALTPSYTTVKGKRVPAVDKATKVTIKIPGDGTFTVRNTKENLGELLARAKKVETSKGGGRPDKLPTGKKISEAGDVAKAYGGAENAYRSVKRQIEALDPNDPETSDKTSKATQLADSLYSLTKAGDAERKLTAAQRNVRIYEDGAEGFREKIAQIQSLKNPGNARLAELADLQKRYAENQKKLGEFKAIANEAEQTAAKEKAALDAPEPPKEEPPKFSEQATNYLDKAAEEALNRIKRRPTHLGTTGDPVRELANIKDYAIYGAAKLAKYGVRGAEWTSEMVKAFGERIKPYLDQIYEAARQHLDQFREDFARNPKPTSVQSIIEQAAGVDRSGIRPISNAIDALQSGLRTARALKEHFTGQPKVSRAEVKLADDFLEADANKIRESLTEIVQNELPPSERGRFIQAINNATRRVRILSGDPESMYRRAAEVAARIEDRGVEVRKAAAIDDLRSTVKRALASPSVDIGYKNRILELMRRVNFTKPTEETIRALKATRDYLDRMAAEGKDVEMPREILDQLEVLTKVPLRELPAHAVHALVDKIKRLEALGRLKVETRKALWDNEKQNRLGELESEETTPYEKRPQFARQPGENEPLSMKLRNWLNRRLDTASMIDRAILPIDALFDMLGDGKGKYRGWIFNHIRGPLDLGFNAAAVLRNRLNKPIVDLVKKYDMGQREAERINVYGLAQQEGGLERMIEMGIDPAHIENIVRTFTDREREVYSAMRKTMDGLLPDLQRMMQDLYNIEVKPVENYWPMPRDWESMVREPRPQPEPAFGTPMEYDELAGWKDMFADFVPPKTTRAERGMTIEREKGAKTPVKMNAFDVWYQHINDVTHLLKTQRELKMAGEMARTDEFQNKYGKAGQALVLDFLDTFARQGRLGGMRRIPWLDDLRTRTSVGIIGFRIASQFVHAANVAFAIERAGMRNYAAAAMEIATGRAREFMDQNFAEAEARGGGEPAMVEAAAKGSTVFGKNIVSKDLARKSMAVARFIDRYNAESTMLGVYLSELRKKGIDPATYLDIPVDKEAQQFALVAARRAVASPLPKDVSMSLSRGALTGGNISLGKSIMQFQNIFQDQWSNIRYDLWHAGIRERNPERAARMFLAVSFAVALETGIRLSVKGAIDSFTGHKAKKEESPEEKAVLEVVRRFPLGGQITAALLYGGSGIPVVDSALEPARQAKRAATTKSPKAADKATIRAMGGAGQLLGIPGAGQISEIAADLVD